MTLMTRLFTAAMLFAGLALAPTYAEEPTASEGTTVGRHAQWCKDNPEKCEQYKARMKEKCAQDPKRCEELKARRAERKAWCETNPEECARKREEFRARREACRANPESCKRHRPAPAPADPKGQSPG